MNQQETSVTRGITVKAPIERAFKVFTERFDTWWPREHHIGKEPMKEAVIEPKQGGRWFERGEQGAECDWGKVLVWEPPNRVVLSWHLNGAFRYDADPSKASEVEVRFISEAAGVTRVELEHRNLDRHGDGWEKLRDGVGDEKGWNGLLAMFAKAAAG